MIQLEIREKAVEWNAHRMRSNKHSSLPCGVTDTLYNNPRGGEVAYLYFFRCFNRPWVAMWRPKIYRVYGHFTLFLHNAHSRGMQYGG